MLATASVVWLVGLLVYHRVFIKNTISTKLDGRMGHGSKNTFKMWGQIQPFFNFPYQTL